MCQSPDGVTTYAGLRASGVSRRDISRKVKTGALIPLRRGVYAAESACSSTQAAARHGGVLGCASAARHAGIWVLDPDDTVHVWLGGHGHAYAHQDCACKEHWDDGPAPGDAFGLPSVPRILRQIRHCLGLEPFFVALESALRQGMIDDAGLAWLSATTDRATREAISFARRDADSGLESLVRWRLRRHGLRIRSQVRIVSVGAVDLLIGDRLIVEADGKENHDGPPSRHRDRVRDAHAAIWGYTTLRFDYAMILHDWPTVEMAILAVVDRGHHLGV